MPLHDSFSRKGGPAKVVKLSTVPTADDLVFSLANARKALRKPVFLAWEVNADKRLLAITCGMDPGSEDARWVLRDGHEVNSPIIWTHDTIDAFIIHTLLSDTLNEVGPAASIPEFLRPTNPAVAANESEGTLAAQSAASDKDFSSESPGSIFAHRYEIVAEIGRGATSTVYKARQTSIDRMVALKVLHPQLLQDENNEKRFKQEAKATSTLSHVNLVLVHDFGTSPLGRPFIVMDFVDGPSLDDIITNQGRLSSQQFIDIFMQCCRGLAHAHRKGIVHRDIKPSNIRLYKDDHDSIVAKVLDFGLAKSFKRDEQAQKLTEIGSVIGSPVFMSPEQCRAEDVDHRTDIYSLGVVMYEAATGVLPFRGKDVFETLYKHIYETPPAFATLGLSFQIPDRVETIIQKAMQKDLTQRYQLMEDLERDIMQLRVPLQNLSESQPVSSEFVGEGQHAEMAEDQDLDQVPQSTITPEPMSAQDPTFAQAAIDETNPVYDAPTPAPVVALTEIDLLKSAQLITETDVQHAAEITARLGGQIAAMLIAEGKLERVLLEVAKRCVILVNANLLDAGRAIILLNYSQRARLNFDEAVEELGWDLR